MDKSSQSQDTAKSYPSDLTQEHWKLVASYIPQPKPGGRPRTANMHAVLNGILYVNRSSCQWRLLPHDFPPWQTVYGYFRRFCLEGTWEKINTVFREQVRIADKRESTPSAAIIDSQSVKTAGQGTIRGYDAGKKIKGRKRHILVDTLGLLLAVVVHTADIQDRDGARLVFNKVKGTFKRLKLVWADGGYAGKLIEWVKTVMHLRLEIIKRSDDTKGFKVLPRRWVVERTFAWLGFCRRLSKDYELTIASSESMVLLASINIMLHRLKPG